MERHPDIAVPTAQEPARTLAWWSELVPAPRVVVAASDETRADQAFQEARSGRVLLYDGDWHNARQLLAAMGRRIRPARPGGPSAREAFLAERETRRLEHVLLSRLTVPVGPGWSSPLARAPSLAAPLGEAFGHPPDRAAFLPLREVLGAIGAHEWFRRGVPVPGLGSVHPRYGVFAPVRSEYVTLFSRVLRERAGPLAGNGARAFDVGTGTGVLAFLLARAGFAVTATDLDARAVASARDDASRLGVAGLVDVVVADLFPGGRARLVVANPPWLPGAPHGPLDRAIYDPEGTVLERIVAGLREHLGPGGEAWLIVSDLAERLGLRAPGVIEGLVASAGLRLTAIHTEGASHPRARGGADRGGRPDPVAAARAAETTRLYVVKDDASGS